MKCKYKFQSKEKFNGKPYCTCFCELCEDLSHCEDNCQIFEDLKELEKYKRALKRINNLVFPDIDMTSITPLTIVEIRKRMNPPLKLYGDDKNVDI